MKRRAFVPQVRASAARCVVGHPARKTNGSANAEMNGTPLTQAECAQPACIGGVRRSASLAAYGHRIPNGMSSDGAEQRSALRGVDNYEGRIVHAASRIGGTLGLQKSQAIIAIILSSLLSIPVRAQQTQSQKPSASALVETLLSRNTSDIEWKAAEKQFQELPANDAVRALFPEIAKGLPDGFTYAAYNCFDPLEDRKIPAWGEFCVVHWLWCKQLACPAKRDEVTNVLLELWSQPVSFYGQMALLQGLCGKAVAEQRMAVLFRDDRADTRLRTEAAVCLLAENGKKYHPEVVALAQHSPPPMRERLFDELASPPHRNLSGIDPVVVRMGFALLLEKADKQRKAKTNGQTISEYGQFLYAIRLNVYLGTAFEPNSKLPIYADAQGIERLYHDTVANALEWWSKHKQDYSD